MLEIGYTLSSEEFPPNDLVRFAQRAEEAGFTFSLISDHYHPWIDRQGHSPFVWSVIGGVSATTTHLRLGTGVTCPIMRIHPAIIAQAAATSAAMMGDRFFLGVGSGENLNEHVIGYGWPPADTRLEMLEEAVNILRTLWEGGMKSYRGEYFTVENARLYTLPERPPPVMFAASGDRAAELAGRLGDGLIATAPDADLVAKFEAAGGGNKPRYGQLTVCWAEDADQAKKTAYEQWPNKAFAGELGQELPLPRHFEQTAQMVREDEVAAEMPHGPDPGPYIEAILEFSAAGFDHVYLHQVGPQQEEFIRFMEQEVMPKVG